MCEGTIGMIGSKEAKEWSRNVDLTLDQNIRLSIPSSIVFYSVSNAVRESACSLPHRFLVLTP